MRACSTFFFGSWLRLCASMTHAIRHGGAKNCALSLDGEHEQAVEGSRFRRPARCLAMRSSMLRTSRLDAMAMDRRRLRDAIYHRDLSRDRNEIEEESYSPDLRW